MYLEVNQTIEETVNLIKDRIRTNTPLAISRYGDGEIYFLNKNSPPEHQQRGCNDDAPHGIRQFLYATLDIMNAKFLFQMANQNIHRRHTTGITPNE